MHENKFDDCVINSFIDKSDNVTYFKFTDFVKYFEINEVHEMMTEIKLLKINEDYKYFKNDDICGIFENYIYITIRNGQ